MPHILSVTFRFAWYDLWVGAYWDQHVARCLWVCPLPCCAFRIKFRL
jgi:hypothetical protein